MKLVTLAGYKELSPLMQGFVIYMQSEWPGSELKGQECPYPWDTLERSEWLEGERLAMLAAIDSEE